MILIRSFSKTPSFRNNARRRRRRWPDAGHDGTGRAKRPEVSQQLPVGEGNGGEAGQDPTERQAIGVGGWLRERRLFVRCRFRYPYARGGKNPNLEAAVMKELGVGGAKSPAWHMIFSALSALGRASDYETTQAYITCHVSFRFAEARVKSCEAYCPWARCDEELREILETVTRLFSDLARKTSWKVTAVNGRSYNTVEENGLTRPLLPEDKGGVDAGWQAAYVICMAGRYAAPIPLAETILAGWLLDQAEMDVPEGVLYCAEFANVALTSVP